MPVIVRWSPRAAGAGGCRGCAGSSPPAPWPWQPPSRSSSCSAAAASEPQAPHYDIAFRPAALTTTAATARGYLEPSEEGTELHIWLAGLPRNPDAVYEVLCDADDWTATAGTFRTDADGKAYVVLTTALRRGEYNAIRVVRRSHRRDGRAHAAECSRRTVVLKRREDPNEGGDMRWLTGLLAIVLALGILAGCGDDEDEPEGGAATPAATEEPAEDGGGGGGGSGETTLTADPGGAISWEPGALSAPAGSVTITLVNDSDTPHAVEVEGNGVEEESETITGSQTELTVDLEPGEYTYYCPVGDHRAGGMEGTLTVE